MSEAALEIRGLSKSFDKKVVDNVDLRVAPGELYALLGPNGAGKTTTLRMAVGLTRPEAGAIHIFGVDALADPLAAKQLTGWLPDEPMLYDKLTPAEYLGSSPASGVAPADAAPEAERLLKWLELWEQRDTPCEGFSRGMKQKVALAGALIHRPRLLILDEPLTGLDANMARAVKGALRAQVDAGAAWWSPPTSSKSPSGSPTGSGSSPMAGCWPRGRSPNCARRRGRMISRWRTPSSG